MRFLASRRWRIFLIAWLLYSVHFATNVVREHYPAFTIAEHGTFRVDEYQGFHSDIFVHRDGHSYINNQVLVSTLAAVPLVVFDPILDALEDYSKAQLASEGIRDAEYRTDKPGRVIFFRLVKEHGLDLRFGAATFITAALFMAPATAAFLVFFYGVLRRRGLDEGQATGLTLLLGFGTPLFFRTSTLNHNLVVMYAMFMAFALLWLQSDGGKGVPLRGRVLAGFFGGLTLATDYIGVVILPLLYAYFVIQRAQRSSWRVALREMVAVCAGSLPPIGFLLFSQWAMFGDPLLPAQFWMPDQNEYVRAGLRGVSLPAPDMIVRSLFDPAFGLYTWAPILTLSLVPARRYWSTSMVLPRQERRWLMAAWLTLVLFSSANQYARLQWNSGFRYLLPLVPFLVLALSDHWIRLGRWPRALIAALVLVHSWVLTVFRESAIESWRILFAEGPQLPWYRVLRMTAGEHSWTNSWWPPVAIGGATVAVVAAIWMHGARVEAACRTNQPGLQASQVKQSF